jgi:hypothetical protein
MRPGHYAAMSISGTSLFASLGLTQQPQAGAARPQNQATSTKATPANPAPRAAEAQARPAGYSAPAGKAPGAGLNKAQNLEQAVQALSDQGRLPPRGSLVDLRA